MGNDDYARFHARADCVSAQNEWVYSEINFSIWNTFWSPGKVLLKKLTNISAFQLGFCLRTHTHTKKPTNAAILAPQKEPLLLN